MRVQSVDEDALARREAVAYPDASRDIEGQAVQAFANAWSRAERRVKVTMLLPDDWQSTPRDAWRAGISTRQIVGLIDEAAYRVAHSRVRPMGAFGWVATALERMAEERA